MAEGLKALNIPFTANIDYFPDISNTYLFTAGNANKAHYIITSAPEEFVEEIKSFTNEKKKLIIFDTKDEWIRAKSTQFISMSHRYFMSTAITTSLVVRPFAFAVSNRMIESIKQDSPWKKREASIIWAHRVTNHTLRNLVKSYYIKNKIQLATFLDNFTVPDPETSHMWNHTGRRHSPQYFDFLTKYKYLDAHGGYPGRLSTISQWDSWKVWEGFLAGCLVITADLDYYNIRLPFRMIPYEHYIPIRYDDLEESYGKLFQLPDIEQERIAKSGQAFVLKYYNPSKMAEYVINA